MAREMPSFFSSLMVFSAHVSSAISTDSLISSSNMAGSSPVSCRIAATWAGYSASANCRPETLTAMRCTARPSARQVLACRQAVRSTQVPIGSIRPVSSATGRNSALLTTPSSALLQRSTASIPETLAVRTSNCGWYRSESSLRARAPRNRSSMVKRCRAIAFMEAS